MLHSLTAPERDALAMALGKGMPTEQSSDLQATGGLRTNTGRVLEDNAHGHHCVRIEAGWLGAFVAHRFQCMIQLSAAACTACVLEAIMHALHLD